MIACWCANPECMTNGCMCMRQLPINIFPPQGCICPPTSEQTCQNPNCPRKDSSKKKNELTSYSKKQLLQE